MRKAEYQEGPKAKKKFERAMTALFQVKKTGLVEKIKKKPQKGKDQASLRWPRPCLGLMQSAAKCPLFCLVSKPAILI
jgi:hypothetical protein